jgi:hypothetical protein
MGLAKSIAAHGYARRPEPRRMCKKQASFAGSPVLRCATQEGVNSRSCSRIQIMYADEPGPKPGFVLRSYAKA